MDIPSQEHDHHATQERRDHVASWLAEHIRPAAHILAEGIAAPIEFETREHQLDALAAIWEARASGQSRALLEMATGLGKTFVAACDAMKFREEWEALHPGTTPRILFVSHRHEINEQACDVFRAVMKELETELFATKHAYLPDVDMRFATYQGILSKLDKFDPQDYEYIVYDEVHHSEAETFKQVRGFFRPVFELGLTATPRRMDELDIRDYFGDAVYKKELHEAIAEGLLADVSYHIVFDDAVKAVIESGFDPKTLQELYELLGVVPRNETIAQNIIDERHRIGLDDAKTIVFCHDVKQANAMARLLGGKAYHSRVRRDERRRILADFRTGRCQVICTRDMFNEGLDVPDAGLVVFQRSTGSEAVFLQQFGRGLRGDRVTVLDFVANIERIARIKALSDAIRQHADRLGDKTSESMGSNSGRTTGLLIHTSHTEFEFDRLTVDILDKFRELRGDFPDAPENVRNVKATADELGLDHATVMNAIDRMERAGWAFPIYRFGRYCGKGLDPEQREAVRESVASVESLPKGPVSMEQFGKSVGVSRQIIGRLVERLGLKLDTLTYGARKIAVLTPAQQQQLLLEPELNVPRAPDDHATEYALAKDLGVDLSSVRRAAVRCGIVANTYRFPKRVTKGFSVEQQRQIKAMLSGKQDAPEGYETINGLSKILGIGPRRLMRLLTDLSIATESYRLAGGQVVSMVSPSQQRQVLSHPYLHRRRPRSR